MASFTVVTRLFPEGTSVGCYDATAYANFPPQPPGTPVTTATASGGSVTFSGLTNRKRYFAAAKIGGSWRSVSFTPGEDGLQVAGGGAITIEDVVGLQAALDAKAEAEAERVSAVTANSGSAYSLTTARTTFLTLTANLVSLSLPSAVTGDPVLRLVMIQDATGSRKMLWPGVRWLNSTAPVLPTTPGSIGVVQLIAIGKGEWLGLDQGEGFGLESFSSIAEAVSGLVLYLRHGEPSGTTMTDSGSGAHNGEYVGGPTLGVAGSLANSGLSDAANTAVGFVGAKYGTVPDNAALDVADKFTIVVRVKMLGGAGTSRGILSRGTGAFYLRIGDTNEIELLQQGEHIVAYGGAMPEDGNWHTIVFGKEGSTIVAEVDGANTLGAVANQTMKTTATPVLVGTGSAGGEHGNHDQDETMLYNRLLTDEERKRLHHAATGVEVHKTLEYGFEDSTLNGFNTAGVGEGPAYPVVSTTRAHTGTHSLKVDLEGEQNRAELILGGTGGAALEELRFGIGDHYRWSFWCYIVAGRMAYGLPGAHNIISQLKSNGEGSPLASIHLWNYNGQKGLWLNDKNPVGGASRDRFLHTMPEGQWHHVELEFISAEKPEGLIKLSLNGEVLTNDEGVQTIVTGRGFNYLKAGLYRNGPYVSMAANPVFGKLTGGGPGEIFFDDFVLTPL